jgi:hypothetical protein
VPGESFLADATRIRPSEFPLDQPTGERHSIAPPPPLEVPGPGRSAGR